MIKLSEITLFILEVRKPFSEGIKRNRVSFPLSLFGIEQLLRYDSYFVNILGNTLENASVNMSL